MSERWMPVLGFEGFYEVSDMGRIRSLRRTTKQGDRGGGMLKPYQQPNGYLTVVLTATALGKRSTRYVHHVVLEAFVGPRPDGMDGCHDPDRDRRNCHLANLRWDTRGGNLADKLAHGTQTRGESHPVAKLTGEQVRAIFDLRGKMSQAEIGRKFSVTGGMVHRIFKGIAWKHVGRAT